MIHSLLPRGLSGEGRERDEDGVPLVLAKVGADEVHKPCGSRATELGVEFLTRFDEITGGIHFVRTFNLAAVEVSTACIGMECSHLLQRSQGQECPRVGFRLLDPRLEGLP